MPEVVNTSALTVENEAAEAEDNRPVMIDVDHVSMSFNMASEQLNNLKEYAIAIARGKLYFEEFKALDDVSFKVRKGDVFGIMGTNGSGKSTILKIIAGVLEPSKGKCTVNGNIAPLIELGAGFDMDLSARENIYLNGALLGYSKQFIDEHFQEIVEFAEVEKFLDMPLKNYSSGMVARIAFAIATVIVPEILVVDEVLSVGDFMFQKKCEDRITQLIEEYGVTVLIVSHSNDQIARLCNKAVWIEKGHVRLQGDAKMVARIYGGLGGRTGSEASEIRVFDALNADVEPIQNGDRCIHLNGENPSAINARMVLNSLEDNEIENLVFVSDNNHANSIIAAAYAGAKKAPIMSLGTESISDSVERVLGSLKPKEISIFDCNGHSKILYSKIEERPWKPALNIFNDDLDIFDYSTSIFDQGLADNYWDGEKIALVCFADNCEALAAAPIIYAEKCPALVYSPSSDIALKLKSFLSRHPRIKACYAFGPDAGKKSKLLSESTGLSVMSFPDCRSISNLSSKKLRQGSGKICIATQSLSQWPELLSSGYYTAEEGISLLLLDQTSLDSFAFCLDFISQEKSRATGISFLGGESGLTDLEISVFSREYWKEETSAETLDSQYWLDPQSKTDGQ